VGKRRSKIPWNGKMRYRRPLFMKLHTAPKKEGIDIQSRMWLLDWEFGRLDMTRGERVG
jgi:hypothetical protein